MTIVDVTRQNVTEQCLFCSKNPKSDGFKSKRAWFEERRTDGLRLKILRDAADKQVAFIEYVPADFAWRPVDAPGYMFIHCLATYRNEHKGRGHASSLIHACEDEAADLKMKGVAVMTSEGRWMASKSIFVKNEYAVVDRRGRFELLVKKFKASARDPRLVDWEKNGKDYAGWHLVYADQCPWHDKAARDLKETAREAGIDLRVRKLTTAAEARQAPSGFGVFSLVRDGALIEDHYISKTRFKNILKSM